METLTFTYRGKEVTAKMEVIQKHLSCHEYHLIGKNRVQLFIFRKNGNHWHHAYGHLRDDLREAILDALIMRFEPGIVTTFMYKGERQIVTVGYINGGGCWRVNINHYYIGNISHHGSKGFRWHIHNEGTWLLPRHMEMFIDMIKMGKIKTPKEYRPRGLSLPDDSTGT